MNASEIYRSLDIVGSEMAERKKSLRGFLGILTVMVIVMVFKVRVCGGKNEFAVKSCISKRPAIKAAATAGLRMPENNRDFDSEGKGMQIVYQLARRSIVKVAVKDAAGSGVIWKIDDGIVIVSNRHLLMKDVRAEIVFGNGETVIADVIGYSQQYDIGFVKISEGAVTINVLRDIYEAVPYLYETESEEARTAFYSKYSGRRVLQVGAAIDKNSANFSIGNVDEISFVPLFNTNVLKTKCFSKAGMSGGGVFDEGGRFLGMISGGEVSEGAEKREAELTYSIPPGLIAAEYEAINERDE